MQEEGERRRRGRRGRRGRSEGRNQQRAKNSLGLNYKVCQPEQRLSRGWAVSTLSASTLQIEFKFYKFSRPTDKTISIWWMFVMII